MAKKEKMRNNESAYPLFTPLYFLLCCTLETVSLGFPLCNNFMLHNRKHFSWLKCPNGLFHLTNMKSA